MEEALCPKCGANVEGLIKWCDCCGAELNPKKTMFSWMIYSTDAFFDMGQYTDQIFDKLVNIPPEPYAEVLQRIEFDFWCFPTWKKAGVYYYASRKQAIVTIEVDGDAYIYGTKEEKLALLIGEVKEKMDMLRQQLTKKKIYIDDLFLQIDEALLQARESNVGRGLAPALFL